MYSWNLKVRVICSSGLSRCLHIKTIWARSPLPFCDSIIGWAAIWNGQIQDSLIHTGPWCEWLREFIPLGRCNPTPKCVAWQVQCQWHFSMRSSLWQSTTMQWIACTHVQSSLSQIPARLKHSKPIVANLCKVSLGTLIYHLVIFLLASLPSYHKMTS